MLVIGRRIGQSFRVGDATITVVEILRGEVRLGIEADKSIPVIRDDAKQREAKP